MSEQTSIDDEEQRARARVWQRQQARKTFAEIDSGAPGHDEVSEADVDAVFDRYLDAEGDEPKS